VRKLFPILAAVLLALPFLMGQQYNVPFSPPAAAASACAADADGWDFTTDGYLSILTAAGIAKMGPSGTPWTVLAWVNIDDSTLDMALHANYDNNSDRNFLVRTDATGGPAGTPTDVEFFQGNLSIMSSATQSIDADSGWQLVALTDNGTTVTQYVYAYGTPCTQTSTDTGSTNTNTGTTNVDWTFGAKFTTSANHFLEGQAAYVAYILGDALSAAEIVSWCADPCAEYGAYDTAGQLEFFYAEDISGTLNDLSSNGRDATIVGTVTNVGSGGPYD